MTEFVKLILSQREKYDAVLQNCSERGCEYSFTNLYLWGRQRAAFIDGQLIIFSQFNRRSVYLYPVGEGDRKTALDTVIRDARKRGIPCRLNGLTQDDCGELERLYPGQFRYHFDRDAYDYVYSIDNLAELKGKKYQKKRNHLNRFRSEHPEHRLIPITPENLQRVQAFVEKWYALRKEADPCGDYLMEQAAIAKAMEHYEELGFEGMFLEDGGEILAVTMATWLNQDTFDVHFEKALDIADGSYAAINQGFAWYLREKHPQVRWLNREDDLGLEGLRKAKLSYYPDHMVEKSWACLLEDGYDY